jgi:hypothetical protein
VWCALLSIGIFGPVLTENTVCCRMSLNFSSWVTVLIPTRLHMADIMLDFSNNTFRNRALLNRYPHVHVISITRFKAM